jgi:hypothetical protein
VTAAMPKLRMVCLFNAYPIAGRKINVSGCAHLSVDLNCVSKKKVNFSFNLNVFNEKAQPLCLVCCAFAVVLQKTVAKKKETNKYFFNVKVSFEQRYCIHCSSL